MKKLVAGLFVALCVVAIYVIFVLPMTDTVSILFKVCALFLVIGLGIPIVSKLREKKS